MNFKDRLKEEMISHDVRTKELSAKTRISESTISSYLKTKNALPNVESAFRISQALDISLNRLVTGHEFYHSQENNISFKDFHKYDQLIKDLDSLTDDQRNLIINMIDLIKKVN